jgi:hypothetical protein
MRAPALFPLSELRLLTREEAAGYLNISTTTFDERVKDGRLPGPLLEDETRSGKGKHGRRKGYLGPLLWDRWLIDQKISDVSLRRRSEVADEMADVA